MPVDQLKVELVTSRFNQMLEEFASIDPGVEFSAIVKGVAVRVIAGALRRTKSADAQRIRENHESAEWTNFEGKKYKLSWYLHNDSLWNRISSKRNQSLQHKLAARGLSKQSWLHQAQDLGQSIEVPAYVANANYKGMQYPIDANHREGGGGANYSLTILNSSPIVQKAGGRDALVFAMQAETRYFYTLLSKGGFRTAASRAAKYPGVYVRPTSTV